MKDWITETGLDAPMLLFALAVLLLIATAVGMVFATRPRRQRERQREESRVAPENAHAMARWIEEGRQLLDLWRERVERLDELQGRLAAMALEIDQLRAQVISLSREGEALLLERDQLRSILVRIGELIQRASEARPGATEGTDPEVGP
jgi:uncharacterized protein HemX